MDQFLDRLISIGGTALAPWPDNDLHNIPGWSNDSFFASLSGWLAKKNGFYAFESALHVFSTRELAVQNRQDGWRSEYGGLADDLFFFAEDLFGGLFAWSNGTIVAFDPETAETEIMGQSLEAWAQDLLSDYNFRTGYPLAHAWQQQFGPLQPGKRLAPKMPFVGGGKFDVSNLYLADPAELMSFRGMLAQKIKNLPEGATIKFKVTD